jgi:hypothetical protein
MLVPHELAQDAGRGPAELLGGFVVIAGVGIISQGDRLRARLRVARAATARARGRPDERRTM